MSPTGKVQGVLIEKDWKFVSYFMSNDFGKTWCERCGNTALYDRNYAFAIIGRRVGVSSDFGETFTLVGPCRDWVGNYIADDDSWRVYDDASREYVSQTRGKTWVRIK
jgi:hypothetical protein